ncbi:hypothetical protein [Siccibacter turicensis]|uniref:hypothetical protein n=1 Tax=Siccibacter turicensis TaxID=357233 RepID=UPI0023F52B29|nr:hypothetical protein [Siccibacter turicensis]
MTNANSLSFQNLEAMALVDENSARFLRRLKCNSYDSFIEMLYIDLEAVIKLLEQAAALRQNDGEDRLSSEIINILFGFGYQSSHDSFINGHSDIVVMYKKYTWIGEAKIHKDYNYLLEGFKQLCTRYSSGSEDDNQGALIFYVKGNNALDVVKKWKTHLQKEKFEDLTFSDCTSRKSLSFFSTHKHDKSGLDYKVRHLAIILGFNPQDKSAKNSKPKRKK